MWIQPSLLHTQYPILNTVSHGVTNQNSPVKEAKTQKTFQEKQRRD